MLKPVVRLSLFPAFALVTASLHAQVPCAGKLRISNISTLKAAGSTGPARYTFLVANDTSVKMSARVSFRNLPADIALDAQEFVVLVDPHKTLARPIFFGTAKSASTYSKLDMSNVRLTTERATATGPYATIYDCYTH